MEARHEADEVGERLRVVARAADLLFRITAKSTASIRPAFSSRCEPAEERALGGRRAPPLHGRDRLLGVVEVRELVQHRRAQVADRRERARPDGERRLRQHGVAIRGQRAGHPGVRVGVLVAEVEADLAGRGCTAGRVVQLGRQQPERVLEDAEVDLPCLLQLVAAHELLGEADLLVDRGGVGGGVEASSASRARPRSRSASPPRRSGPRRVRRRSRRRGSGPRHRPRRRRPSSSRPPPRRPLPRSRSPGRSRPARPPVAHRADLLGVLVPEQRDARRELADRPRRRHRAAREHAADGRVRPPPAGRPAPRARPIEPARAAKPRHARSPADRVGVGGA